MVRIAIVIPYASMANLAWDVFQEHTEQMRLQALDATEYSLDILVASTTQELLPQWPDCDAMIARGATYLDLCRRSLSIPVIELIINGTDLVNTLLQLRQKYGPVPAAILGTQNMILGVEKLARQLGVDVTPYCFQENSLLEIRRCVEQAARDGKRVIIGGGTGCRLAEEIGLTSMLITSGREAFWNAISEAKQQATISQVEREKALRADFSIGAFIGYLFAENAETHHMIVVTGIPQEEFGTAKVHVVSTLDEALELARKLNGGRDLRTTLLPHGANTLPKLV